MKFSKKNLFSKGTLILMALILAGLVLLNVCWAEEPQWDVCYEMANRNVTWTYAGRDAK